MLRRLTILFLSILFVATVAGYSLWSGLKSNAPGDLYPQDSVVSKISNGSSSLSESGSNHAARLDGVDLAKRLRQHDFERIKRVLEDKDAYALE